jgi:peroxiredoxin
MARAARETPMPSRATLPEALADILAQDMTMSQALRAYADELQRLSPDIAKAYVALIERLRRTEAGVSAPGVGDVFPDFALPDQDGRLRRLGDFIAEGPTIVSINRGHWCPFCRIELDALAKANAHLERSGARTVSIMPDRQAFTKIARERGVPFPILSDIDAAYALELGLCFYIGDDLVRMFRSNGHQMPMFQGNDSWFLPIPATYVIDWQGRVAARMVDPDFRLSRMAVDEIAKAIVDLSAVAK